MNSKNWRGTILFTVILVVMGSTVGLKLYGIGEETTVASAATSATTGTTSSGEGTGPSGATGSSGSSGSSSSSDDTSTGTSSGTSGSRGTSGSASAGTTTITGTAVETRYGAVQVKVTFSGSTITAVDTVQSPSRDGRDVEINQRALPILEQEVLASQSASIDTVSGATYTSEGYMQSVQSAIDQR